MKRGFSILLLCALCILAASCRKPSPSCPGPKTLFGESANGPKNTSISPKLSAEILVDASLSMEGFVKGSQATQYDFFIQGLQRAFTRVWHDTRVQFFQFGAKVVAVQEHDGYLAATKPSFYTNPEIYKETHIEAAFKSIKADTLSIVVTDLFQTNSDVATMVETLSEKLANSDLAFAIVGVRSEFDGTVYDVGPKALKFKYKTTADPKTFRPFYTLIMGRLPDVLQYVSELNRVVLDTAPESHTLILTQEPFVQPLSFSNAKVMDLKGAVQTTRFLSFDNQPVFAAELRGKPSQAFRLVARVPFKEIDHGPSVPLSDSKVLARGSYCGEGSPTEISEVGKVIGYSINQPSGAVGSVEFTAPISAFDRTGIYAFDFRILLNPEKSSLPDWCRLWSMSSTAAAGTTTYNLEIFLSDLWTAMLNTKTPEVGRLQLYLSKK